MHLWVDKMDKKWGKKKGYPYLTGTLLRQKREKKVLSFVDLQVCYILQSDLILRNVME